MRVLIQSTKRENSYIEIADVDSGKALAMGDSTLIIEKLVEGGVMEDLNGKLPPAEKAMDLRLRALLEEKLYFYQSYEKWHQNYYTMRSHVMSHIHWPLQSLIGLLAYRKQMATLHGQGTSRYSPEELTSFTSFKKNIWQHLNSLLVESKQRKDHQECGTSWSKQVSESDIEGVQAGDDDLPKEPFWVLGNVEGPSEADFVLFGFISSALVCTACPESTEIVQSCPAVMEYARRIHERYFPDYEG